MPKIVYYSGPENAMGAVQSELDPGEYRVTYCDATPEAVGNALKSAHAFLDASMKVKITSEMIEQAPNLALIITATTGADHIDGKALEARKIPLLTLKGQTEILNKVTPAAEHSWLLLMSCARRMRSALTHVTGGEWERTEFPGKMLRGSTVGIIGCGRIGQWMGRYARAFEMNVIGYDPYMNDWPEHIEQRPLEEVLGQSDFVSIHVAYTEQTHGMIGANEISLIKDGASLINTARGAITDEDAILAALKSGKLASVGLDVLSHEPDIQDSPLWQYSRDNENCIITPHIGGFSPDALNMVLAFTAKRIAKHFA